MDVSDYEIMNTVSYDIAWCPGCGNYGILNTLKRALSELSIRPQDLVIVSGIGQAAKIPHYLRTNAFNGLHGRALPAAVAIKAVNPSLTVIAESGDGCMYGEGGNHLTHTILRNPDIALFVHDNMVYGLTKGQASPTSARGFETPLQTADRGGYSNEPFNPLALAIAMDASFVARAFIGDSEQTKELMKAAIEHKGFALLDIFQPCVTYNRINTYEWFKKHTYYIDDSHDSRDRIAAFRLALETEKLPLGVFYINPNKPTFEEGTGVYRANKDPVCMRSLDKERLARLIESKTGA
ncbi:MAG: 2-oxoacid ferredoxin oxidoreductase [Candidatus Thorarchaeota archaeon]|nr:MAG: 2-oxoacid ferredoxin oxidoreductase [Candidatus Thorarchaeota archaeon]